MGDYDMMQDQMYDPDPARPKAMTSNEALTKAADYCWERARDFAVLRDRSQPGSLSKEQHQAKIEAFTEAAQAIQGMRN